MALIIKNLQNEIFKLDIDIDLNIDYYIPSILKLLNYDENSAIKLLQNGKVINKLKEINIIYPVLVIKVKKNMSNQMPSLIPAPDIEHVPVPAPVPVPVLIQQMPNEFNINNVLNNIINLLNTQPINMQMNMEFQHEQVHEQVHEQDLTQEDENNIEILMGFGFNRHKSVEVYLSCNKNIDEAANLIFEFN